MFSVNSYGNLYAFVVRNRSVQYGTFSGRDCKWSANQDVVNSTSMNRVGRVNPWIYISVCII